MSSLTSKLTSNFKMEGDLILLSITDRPWLFFFHKCHQNESADLNKRGSTALCLLSLQCLLSQPCVKKTVN